MPMTVSMSVQILVSVFVWDSDLRRFPCRQVNSTDKGLEAIIFTAEVNGSSGNVLALREMSAWLLCQGDMRNALNSLQATHAGFAIVNDVNVFKVSLPCLPILW